MKREKLSPIDQWYEDSDAIARRETTDDDQDNSLRLMKKKAIYIQDTWERREIEIWKKTTGLELKLWAEVQYRTEKRITCRECARTHYEERSEDHLFDILYMDWEKAKQLATWILEQ